MYEWPDRDRQVQRTPKESCSRREADENCKETRDALAQGLKWSSKYTRHNLQFETQRDLAKKTENELGPGRGVLYRDFASSYNCTGLKVTDLVFVLLWKSANGSLVQRNIHNFSGETPPKSDSSFYVDAMTHLLQHTDICDHL
jgi:hypothetical protein